MTTPLLDWCAANPWLSFWFAWPTASVLIVAAWMAAEVMSRAIGLILQLATLASNTLVITLRGYAPWSAEAHKGDDDDEPTATT